MRIQFFFPEDLAKQIKTETNQSVENGFFLDFPCRVNYEDNFLYTIIPEHFRVFEMELMDNLVVESTRFDSDEKGIFQIVWLG